MAREEKHLYSSTRVYPHLHSYTLICTHLHSSTLIYGFLNAECTVYMPLGDPASSSTTICGNICVRIISVRPRQQNLDATTQTDRRSWKPHRRIEVILSPWQSWSGNWTIVSSMEQKVSRSGILRNTEFIAWKNSLRTSLGMCGNLPTSNIPHHLQV